MINAFVRKRVEAAVQNRFGSQAVKVLRGIGELAARQGGNSIIENYRLLGKRVFVGAGAGLVVVTVGGVFLVRMLSSKSKERKAERAESEALERQWFRERGVEPVRLRGFYPAFGKRACDIAVSVVALPIVGVVTAASAVAIKREDGGPVFYNAPRVGKGGREFIMFKLRSMKENAPDLVMEDGSTYNGADDPRMTQVGAFLRKTSLDEIPQFLNVLRGDMSVVGPRPDLKRETELYEGDEALKLAVKPGVTGYAAVYGRNSLPWRDRLALDVHYVHNLSFPLDAKVFAKTFTAVFKQEGIYVEEPGKAGK